MEPHPIFHDVTFYCFYEQKYREEERKRKKDQNFQKILWSVFTNQKKELKKIFEQVPSKESPQKIPDLILRSDHGLPLLKYTSIQLTHCIIKIINTKNPNHKISQISPRIKNFIYTLAIQMTYKMICKKCEGVKKFTLL